VQIVANKKSKSQDKAKKTTKSRPSNTSNSNISYDRTESSLASLALKTILILIVVILVVYMLTQIEVTYIKQESYTVDEPVETSTTGLVNETYKITIPVLETQEENVTTPYWKNTTQLVDEPYTTEECKMVDFDYYLRELCDQHVIRKGGDPKCSYNVGYDSGRFMAAYELCNKETENLYWTFDVCHFFNETLRECVRAVSDVVFPRVGSSPANCKRYDGLIWLTSYHPLKSIRLIPREISQKQVCTPTIKYRKVNKVVKEVALKQTTIEKEVTVMKEIDRTREVEGEVITIGTQKVTKTREVEQTRPLWKDIIARLFGE